MDRNSNHKISKEDVLSCWSEYYLDYFVEILNSDFILKEAKGDLLSLIGSKYDLRQVNRNNEKPCVASDPNYIILGENKKEIEGLKKDGE